MNEMNKTPDGIRLNKDDVLRGRIGVTLSEDIDPAAALTQLPETVNVRGLRFRVQDPDGVLPRAASEMAARNLRACVIRFRLGFGAAVITGVEYPER